MVFQGTAIPNLIIEIAGIMICLFALITIWYSPQPPDPLQRRGRQGGGGGGRARSTSDTSTLQPSWRTQYGPETGDPHDGERDHYEASPQAHAALDGMSHYSIIS